MATRAISLTIGILTFAAIIATLTISSLNLQKNPSFGPVSQTSCDVHGETRRQNAALIRIDAALRNAENPPVCHIGNGDDALYSTTHIGSFSKGLPHNSIGEVDHTAYQALLNAVNVQRTPEAFAQIPLHPLAVRKLTNPQGGLAFDLIGGDPHTFAMPPAPALASAEAAYEYVELLWMALTRDVKFSDFGTDPLIARAVAQLNAIGGGPVTPSTIFRGFSPGCQVGPLISQFFYLPCYYGPNHIEQKLPPQLAGESFMTTYPEFLNIQNGRAPAGTTTLSGPARFMINGRDLGNWVHVDMLFQAYHMSLMTLLNLGAPLNPTNPYLLSQNQEGFATFGGPFFSDFVTKAGRLALTSAWHKKWMVSRRLRPEAYAGRVHVVKNSLATYPLHPNALTGDAQSTIHTLHGTYLLPQMFPEGSPLHPSYAAGHASVAGSCVTVLKALFNGDWVIPAPVQPDATGANTIPYVGPALTVTGELNKVAFNVAYGRHHAGVHYRSDGAESLRQGEQVAISMLRDYKATFPERFTGWTFQSFDGQQVII
jgi:hypothetical protein